VFLSERVGLRRDLEVDELRLMLTLHVMYLGEGQGREGLKKLLYANLIVGLGLTTTSMESWGY